MAAILEPPLEQARTATQEQQSALRLFTVAEYHTMIEADIFNEKDRVELWKGVVVKMSPKGKRHAAATDRATKVFIKLLGDRVIVRNQNPIVLDDLSEPEPDIVLAAPQEKEYTDRLPQPSDVLLVLEVADTSLKHDRDSKSTSYAKAGIVQYLVLKLKTSELIDFREPSPEGYRSYKTLRANETFSFVAFPEVRIQVSELLPPE
ncbi:MAG: Uma2 family endonuclease [Pyrinomonadaceae bacterium]|nr:Uma2 family endonuclease [Pyrinomonadaceae bacterium]